MELSRFMADQHQRLVLFPIVLLFSALVLDVAGLIRRSARAHWAARLAWMAGTATLLLAFVCGICAEIWAGRAGVPQHPIELHEVAATFVAWGFIALTGWRLFLEGRQRRAMKVFVVCGLALYSLMTVTGYLGGKLVTEYGASVTGAEAKTVVSFHDLNTLAQRQTDLNLEYSDFMHHMAGWFVFALAASIFVRELWPHHAGKVQWVGPTLLKVGGVLLFLFADADLYALTDLRQFYDREVQAHKLLALIMTGVGVYLLFRRHEPTKTGPFQNRIIAVLALVGGGLLFTHVHTVAPYANVAAGVYINHVTMGLVALAIGAVKLWEDKRKLLFPALLGLQAFLLITYTEGLPWFIGYGHYNRWGANGGTIAPFGKTRAELVFDPKTAQMDVRLFDRFEDKPVTIAATNLNVIIARGYQRTVVPLIADGDRFTGHAEFLKDAPTFDASVTLPDGRTGYFDPWVTSAVAGIPPNEIANFVCPMHDGIRSKTAGECKLCGMSLVPVDHRQRVALHDEKYGLGFEYRDDRLIFTPQHMGALQIVHEHPLHLIITSDDLTYFDHIHPVPQSDGSLAIDYRFPRDGNYLLFADLTPRGDRSQVFRIPVNIGGAPDPEPVLTPPPVTAREIGRYHVELLSQPRQLVAERETQLIFRLVRDGKPVVDLQPYIGALGHCVIVSEDTQTYLHCHPEQLTPPLTGGPVVSFHAQFPKPGHYKIWGQFKHHGEILVADFVVEVEKPVLPRWLATALFND